MPERSDPQSASPDALPPRRTGAAWLRIGMGVVDLVAAAVFLYFRGGDSASQMIALCLVALGIFYVVRGVLGLRM